MLRAVLGVFISVLLFAVSSHAAFQEALWGARPSGLAGAFTALADDSNAPAYNPAGISLMNHNEITFMYAQLYSGVDFQTADDTSRLGLSYLSYVPSVMENRYGSFGVSWANFNATNLYREDTFYLTYANAHTVQKGDEDLIFAYGANLKMLKRSFSTDSRTDDDPVFQSGRESNAITADLGFLIRPNFSIMPGLKVGLAAQNITEPDIGLASSDRVPAKYTLGVAYQDRDHRLINPTLDVSRRRGQTMWAAGWEGWFARDAMAFRFGGNADLLSGGLGYQFRLMDSVFMRIDYSLIWPLEVEGSDGSHRLSLTMSF